jgi:hypothetical protein
MSKTLAIVVVWASAFLFATSYAISHMRNPLLNGEAMYGGSALDAHLASSPQLGMKKSISKAFKCIGRVASFHTGEEMLPLEKFTQTGEVPSALRSKKPLESIKTILRGISTVASFHPGEDFQALDECKPQVRGT